MAKPPPVLPVLLCLFVGSGASALVYEIVWFQLLELVIGATTVSLGVLLATFMGGLCLGSLLFPRLVSARTHPLLVYAALELGIGVIAVVVLFVLPAVGSLYLAHAGYGFAGILLRAAVCALLLLPPTVLMGATLPAVARWVEATPQGVSWLGFLYTSNIVGAVLGCVLAGFYLLRVHDMAVATYAAAAVNAALAAIAFGLAASARHRPRVATQPAEVATPAGTWPVHVTIGLSGLTALGAQVVWTRELALLLGSSVYTFSIILAVFLFALGAGSSFGSFVAERTKAPRLWLALSQLLLIATLAWAGFAIHASLPYWPVDPFLMVSPWFNFQLDVLRCLWAIFPSAFLWGASMPLALAAAAAPGVDPGRMVGSVYAANTVGAIIGALGFSLIAIPAIGVHESYRLLMALTLVAGLLMMVMPRIADGPGPRERPLGRPALAAASAVAVAATAVLGWAVPPVPPPFAALGRMLPKMETLPTVLYTGEGINSWISVVEWQDGYRSFHVSGTAEASNYPPEMRLQRMLAHTAALTHPRPRSVLVIGHGAGVTAGSFIPYPEIERIVVAEIEPLIPPRVGPFFAKENYDLLKDPRVEIVADDGRHFLFTTRERFDIITTDPLQPWAKGAATLYTREFFLRAKEVLNPGGVITQYVQLFESTPEVVKSELATFFEVFPNGVVWANEKEGAGYDTLLYARREAEPIDVDAVQRRLEQPGYGAVADSLAEVGFNSATDIFSTYAGSASDLKAWLADAQINTDRNLRLQYLAGLGKNLNLQESIYADMLRHLRFPEHFFTGSEETLEALREAIESRRAE